MGLFGSSSNQSQASSSGQADSGLGLFAPKNKIRMGGQMIDFGEPVQVAGLLLVLTLGYLAWKRFK